MFNVWEYGRKKVTNLRASMRTNRPLSRSQSQSQLNGDDSEDKSGDVTPSDETHSPSSATLPRLPPINRPDSPTSSTTSSSSRADPPPVRPSTRPPNKRNSSASTSSNTDAGGGADPSNPSALLTPGAAATSPPTLPATRVKSPAPAIPISAAKASTSTSSSTSASANATASLPSPATAASTSSSSSGLPSPLPSTPRTPSNSRSDEDPIHASVLSRVSNKFGPAVKRKELLHLSSPTPANGNAGILQRQTSAPGTPSARRNGAVGASSSANPVVNGEASRSDDEAGAVGGAPEPTPSISAAAAAAAVAADARIRREAAAAAAAAAAVPASSAPSSVTINVTATVSSHATSVATTTTTTTTASTPTPKPTLPTRMNSMRRRSQQGQDSNETPSVSGGSASRSTNNNNNNTESAANEKNTSNNKNAGKGKKSPTCEKCGKECSNDETMCGSCKSKEQKQQQKKNRESKALSMTQEEPSSSSSSSAKYGMCPRPGCRTLTHPSWRFCCTCSKNLKPFEILGTLAHMDILGKAANAVVKGGGFPQDPATLQQDTAKAEQRTLEDVQTSEELIKAVINGNVAKVVNLMLKGVSSNTMDPDGISALNYACWHDRLDIVRVLCSFDADLNQRDARGVTALHVACNRSNGEELPGYLVKHGADINLRGDNGESILHHAAAGGNIDGITFAIRNGVDVNDVDQDGATPLSYAIVCDNVDTLEYLLSNGALLDTRCHKGQTILHRAVQYRKMSSLKFAVDEGLKILDRDVECRNALAIAHVTNAPAKIFAFLRDALRNELERCSFCEDLPAHVQFLPCGHQYSCDDCCSRWKKCKCGEVIDKKVDVITDDKGESGAIQEDEVKRIETELSRLQMERERFNEEKTCAVCMDRQKAIVFDCGHTTCVECSIKMRLCHTCRKPIAKKIKFY